MYMGPFVVEVPKEAELIEYDALTTEEQQTLCGPGIRYNPSTHEVFRFPVFARLLLSEGVRSRISKWSRRLRRNSYAAADNMVIQVRRGSDVIRFVGILPQTTRIGMDTSSRARVGAEAKLAVPLVAELKVNGQAKREMKRGNLSISADHKDSLASWTFYKPYLAEHQGTRLVFLGIVPRETLLDRHVHCTVRIAQGNRALVPVKRQKVLIPNRGE